MASVIGKKARKELQAQNRLEVRRELVSREFEKKYQDNKITPEQYRAAKEARRMRLGR